MRIEKVKIVMNGSFSPPTFMGLLLRQRLATSRKDSKKAAFEIPAEADGIKEGLERLFNMSNANRIEMGNNGFHLVKDKFIWSSIAKRMTQVYR